jgi:hypothetical protein
MFLCAKNKTPTLCASRQANYRLSKKIRRVYGLFGTFLLFSGNNTRRKLRLFGAVTGQARRALRIAVVFIF